MKLFIYKHSRICALIFFFILTVYRPLFSAPVIIDESFEGVPLGLSLEYLEDREGILELIDLEKETFRDRWISSGMEVIQAGYTRSVFWVRFTVENKKEKRIRLYLEQAFPLIDKLTLFVPGKDGHERIETGDTFPFGERQIEYRNFVFPLKIKSGTSVTYYLRYQTKSSMNVELNLWKISKFEKKKYIEAIFLWMFYGSLLVVALNTLFLFLYLREVTYLYYNLFLVFLALFTMSLNGFAFQFLWPNSIWWANICIPVFLGILNYVLVQFAVEFTNVRQYLENKYDLKILIVLNIMKLSGLILALLTIVLDNYHFGVISTTILTGINIILGSLILLYGIINFRTRGSVLLLVSWIPLLIGSMLYVFNSLTIIPDTIFVTYSLHVGALLTISLISFAIADKIYIMKDEWKKLNLNLEEKVRERTAELKMATEELELMNDSLFMLNDQIEKAHQIASMDMRMAANVQAKIFPQKVPKTSTWDISFIFKPFSSVSGDLYDFYSSKGELKGLSLLDVSGHGVASGLVTMIARTIFERHFKKGMALGLNELLENANTDLVKEIGMVDHYLTGIMLRFNENKVEYVNAAHTSLLLKHADSGSVEVMDLQGKSIRGWFLGFAELENPYEVLEFSVKKDDVLLLYTDGLVEGPNEEDKPFGYTRLIASLEKAPSGSSREILDFIMDDFFSYIKDESLTDDLTVIMLKRLKTVSE